MAAHFVLRPAERKKAKLRLALTGPSGSGKTTTAVRIAHGLGGDTVVLDTERHRADLCSHIMPFKIIDFDEPYTPERYIEALRAAEASGAQNIIIDSLSHEWFGPGGILDQQLQASQLPKMNTFTAWAKVTPRHKALIEAITRSPAHIIVTMRSKTKWISEDENGKIKPVKMGLEPIQRDDIEFEFMITLLLDNEHRAHAITDHTGLYDGRILELPGEGVGEELLVWLNTGTDPDELPALKKEMHDLVKKLDMKWEAVVAEIERRGYDFPEAPVPRWTVEDYRMAATSLRRLTE